MTRTFFTLMVAAVALCAATAFSAQDKVVNRHGGDPLIVPAASGLHYKSTDGDGTSKFDGRIMLSGTYYYDAGADADGATLQLIPDRETWARLPRFKEHGTPASLYMSEAKAFAKASGITKRTARGKTQIWADRFEAGIECDVPFFNARFVALVQPLQKFAAKDQDEEGC
jgi:hypothetical protein